MVLVASTGGTILITVVAFLLILMLLVAGLLLIWQHKTFEDPNANYQLPALPLAIAVGAVLGFLSGIIGIGGGTLLDMAKAVSIMLTNEGEAKDYQGWDLVKSPGIFKIGVPTLSGTGAETSRTCVLTNYDTGVKLGMNSHHSVFDVLVLDPNLSQTVPKDQFFYTAMDTYIHCVEY